jgi:3-hydroxybutyryl-CoA dehydratase
MSLHVEPITHFIDQQQVRKYADAARDHNPIHLDEDFAETTPYGRTIAHGMLVLALVSEAMAASHGRRWANGGTLNVRWRGAALPPVRITASATLKEIERGEDGDIATYDVRCEDAGGTLLLNGTATVPVVPDDLD